MHLFHYHLVTSELRDVEARYVGKLGFELVARYGRVGEEAVAAEPGVSWEKLAADGFKLRLTEVEHGAVNVVIQPGHWRIPRVDHLGVALDEDEFHAVLDRANDRGLRIQEHGGRRTFVSTNAGYRLEVHPAARVDRRAARPQRRAAAHRARPARRRPGHEDAGARRPARAAVRRELRLDRRDARPLPAGRARRAARAERRALRLAAARPRLTLLERERSYEAPGSRWRPPGRSSSGCAPRSSRPARPASGRSPACTRSTSERLLAASTDGVGTKLMLARRRGALRDCGADLAAHCINDVAHERGATPLMLLDYVAANEIDLEQVAELVEGAAEVCREAGVALVGGETAELPGIYREGELDFAGTCVGIVDRDDLIDGSDDRGRRRRDRLRLGRRARERLHARPAVLEERGLRRPRPARADAALPRRRAGAARPREGLRARHRRRDPRQPRARPARRAAPPSSTGTRGSARRSSAGSRATSTRTSCGASSTSASAGAPSSPSPAPGELVIGRIA